MITDNVVKWCCKCCKCFENVSKMLPGVVSVENVLIVTNVGWYVVTVSGWKLTDCVWLRGVDCCWVSCIYLSLSCIELVKGQDDDNWETGSGELFKKFAKAR